VVLWSVEGIKKETMKKKSLFYIVAACLCVLLIILLGVSLVKLNGGVTIPISIEGADGPTSVYIYNPLIWQNILHSVLLAIFLSLLILTIIKLIGSYKDKKHMIKTNDT
jgi:Na+-transporting methylmalonyl-CoA/oxaloacetate decarboxylase beta subunit